MTNTVGINIDETDLTDSQIMSYRFVPKPSSEALSYITISTRVSKVENNKILAVDTSIYIFVPYSLMRLPSSFKRKGNRIDNLVMEVNKLFNNTREFGIGKIQLLPNEPFSPAEGYDGFIVKFRTLDLNA